MTDANPPQDLLRLKRRGGDPKMIGLWKVGRTIGKGSSGASPQSAPPSTAILRPAVGRVRLARHSKTGQYAAVKIVSKTALLNSRMSLSSIGDEADRILHSIEREIVIMKLIEHPNIMRLYDVWETSTELYLILEYVEGGELFDYLCSKGRLSSAEALGHFQQIIAAIDYCHRFNIAHRDLKPENLLLDRDKNIKVADFGMAVWQGSGNMLNTACGSPHYAAPEVIMGKAYDGTASDIWSCGVVLYALLAGRLPFDDEDLPTLLEKVKIGKFTMPTNIDSRAQNLIRRMLEKDVRKRITIPEILRHPFYTSQKPKPMQCDVPKLDEIARPLTGPNDIDADIFANLRTLWPGVEDEEIKARLVDDKPSWEKGVYNLLVRYREKHLEEYDEGGERQLAEKREKKRKAKRAAEAEERERAFADLPPRTGPPTPSRAGGRRGVPQRSPSPSPTPGPSRIRESGAAAALAPSPQPSTVASTAASPTPPSLRSPRPQAPLPPIQVPQVEDERVQQFLHQIAEHLSALQTGGTTANAADYEELMSPLTDIALPAPLRRFGDEIQIQDRLEDDAEDPFCIVEVPRESTKPLIIRRRADREGDKENAGAAPYLTVQTDLPDRKSSLRSNTTTGTSSTASTSKRVQLLEPPSSRGRLKKRRVPPPASPATSACSEGSFVLPSTPKRRWFGALFRVKPASYHLLLTQDAGHTHATCKRVLEEMGVAVATEQYRTGSDALVLACTLADSRERDAERVMAPVRGVRFRVEIGRPGAAHAAAGYAVLMRVVLEKGAASTLRLVYDRLRRDWDPDSPPVPFEAVSTRELEDERFVEVVYEH
ncbi:kinase-like domain-containing protein [Daedaleopsis nitida]|nr:kinase-like domain-containing protein [Daedaleopsis nitida]